MLLYKDGWFYGEKVSFQIPDGFYFENDPDMTGEYGFCAWGPKRKTLFCWRFYEDCAGSAEELRTWFSPDSGTVPLSGIIPIKIHGLTGHYALYRTRREQYYEARFDLGEGEEFVLLVELREGDIRDIVTAPELKAVTDKIWAR